MADCIELLNPRKHVDEALRQGHLDSRNLGRTLRTSLRDAAKEQNSCSQKWEKRIRQDFER